MQIDRDKAILGLAVVVVIALAAFCVLYRHNETVQIKDRYWSWELSVKYDVVTYRPEESCTGTGSKRKCTTEMVRHVDTYTRCNDFTSGRDLPPQRPDIPCAMRSGDYISEWTSYHIIDERDRTFPFGLWDYLEPGYTRLVQTDIFGNVTDKGKE